MVKNKRNEKGITLIALVVTIVVLLILAGVSISMLSGENGIIRQAQEAKNTTRAEAIKERIRLWKSEQKINEYTGNTTTETLVDQLYEEGLITESERDELIQTGFIQIGKEKVDLSLSEDNPDLELLKKYLLGIDKKGIDIKTITNIETASSISELKFIGNEIIEQAETELEIINIANEGEQIFIYFKYNGLEYKVYVKEDMNTTSVEEQKGTVIFEGNLELQDGAAADFLDIDLEYNEYLKSQYEIWVEVDGFLYSVITDTEFGGFYVNNRIYHKGLIIDTNIVMFSTKDGSEYFVDVFWNDTYESIVVKKIIHKGNNNTILEENGFWADCNATRTGCAIYATPDGSYEIPETIDGVVVEEVWMQAIKGKPTFVRPVKLNPGDDPPGVREIKVTTSELDFIFDFSFSQVNVWDLSEAGDNIEISESWLEEIRYSYTTLYVSPAVKAKYQSYDNIIAK